MFRWLLTRGGLKPLTKNEMRAGWRGQDYSDTVVVVLGPWPRQVNPLPGVPPVEQWVVNVAEGGGAVLVATDSGGTVSLGSKVAPAQFSSARVITPRPFIGEWMVFNGNQMAQFAVPRRPPPGGGPLWELFWGERPLTRVVNELPGHLPNVRNSSLTAVAGFPPNAEFQANNFPLAGGDFAFVAGIAAPHPNSFRPFRFLAVADPAVFRNGEMVAGDGPNGTNRTDNLAFADRVVTFLTHENDEKQRTKCILFEDGNVIDDYAALDRMLKPPLPPLPKLDWEKLQPKLVDLGNHLLDKVQENDIPNRLMTGPTPDAPHSWLRILVGLVLTGAALWAALTLVRRVWGAREPTDLAAAPPGGRPPPPPDGAAGVFGRRGKELTNRDNLLEPARAACRDFFDDVGRPPEPGPRLPKVVITDEVRKPDTLRQALRDIWAVAYGRPAPVSAMKWAALEPLLARARAAHKDGKWRFVEAEAWPDVATRPRGEA